MPREVIEHQSLSPRQRVEQLAKGLPHIDNTAQLGWLLEAADKLFGIQLERVDSSNWQQLYDAADKKMSSPGWEDEVLKLSKLESLFLTNDFDDPLAGFNTQRYIPCLRTDELVFHFCKPAVQQRLQKCAGTDIQQLAHLRSALQQRFQHFTANGAKACAISLPPWFAPQPVSHLEAEKLLSTTLTLGENTPAEDQMRLGYWVFWTLADLCQQFKLPFDLMIGVNRRVYPAGVFQGQDLYDSRVSLIQYANLFNAFPTVKFPISVLASVTNQELVSYAWIFPNVICHGHWWYSNTPAYIAHDIQARLEAVPRNKVIGYYSDMYKLEFALPKFAMFKRCLAHCLAEQFVIGRRWSESRAVELGLQVLRGNVQSTFNC
jgi:glucuronate isomerase